jgi:hypothetical protein
VSVKGYSYNGGRVHVADFSLSIQQYIFNQANGTLLPPLHKYPSTLAVIVTAGTINEK